MSTHTRNSPVDASARHLAGPLRCIVAALALMVAMGACARSEDLESSREASRSNDAAFWGPLGITGDEAEGFGSLAELAKSADSIVTGAFSPFEVSRVIQGDAAEDQVVYASTQLTVEETIAGAAAPGDVFKMEFLLPVAPDSADNVISEINSSLPPEPVVVFLRAKQGTGEEGLFRVVNSLGLWASTDRSAVDTPLAAEPATEEGPYAQELQGVDTVDELIQLLKQITAEN